MNTTQKGLGIVGRLIEDKASEIADELQKGQFALAKVMHREIGELLDLGELLHQKDAGRREAKNQKDRARRAAKKASSARTKKTSSKKASSAKSHPDVVPPPEPVFNRL